MMCMKTHRAEIAARNKRLMAMEWPMERPGAVPGDTNGGKGLCLTVEEMESRIYRALADGPKTKTEIREACGSSSRIAEHLNAMIARGLLRTWKDGGTHWVEWVE